ncbi:translation initiation factor IF-2 [Oribacterium sp. WCC10]|uniref:translation initiation factor IF-2 n=1 Tax=Oribacterium sp. WCC10 TaxID=1855343 RepID=UPI0008EA1F91|nr:translation initiation factor IF-2 [Oribacterium sp. WCC10]SFG52040.1 translation initiation factor IF-2 [Oribacterium sp. WCC10]
MSDENQKENGLNSKDAKKGEAPKKKKLAVVFHSQNSANHKNHPLGGKLSTAKEQGARKTVQAAEQKEKEKPKKTSPNGRPLPPGTARVTPLRELNEIQKRQAEEEAKREAERKAAEEEARRKAEEEAKRKAEEEARAQEEARKKAQQEARSAAASQERTTDRPARSNDQRPRFDRNDRNDQSKPFGQRNDRGNRPQGGGFHKDGQRPAGNAGRTGDRNGQQRPGQRPSGTGFGGQRRTESTAAAVDISSKPTTNRNAHKPADKNFGNKNFDNERAEAAKRNRNTRKQNKYTAEQSYERDDEMAARKKKTGKGAFIKPEVVKPVEEEIKSITIPEVITIKELADKMKQKPADIIKKLFMKGQMVTLNTELSYEEAENIAVDYDILCEKEEKIDVIAELVKDDIEDTDEDMVSRPPVVCVMGHVDHGKTSILDAIRNTNVTAKEAGGITQSIGAYQVSVNVNGEDRLITFLDTPGHEAFTAMRMRGAQSTDIAVLVVAADDGVMPQTVEAINHAKAANTPIIVAINKIDKEGANPDRVKQELMKYDLVPEDYGGDTICVPVSAKKGIGIEDLLENVVLEADVMELKANQNRSAYGVVIEAELDKGRGSVARLLVQKGTLHQGDVVAVGSAYGKVRAMTDDKGRRIKKAGPSQPCEILGLNAVPNAGEIFQVKDNEKEAKAYAAAFVTESKQKMVEESKKKVSLDALFDQIKAGEIKELPIVIKADVQGSVEAVKDSLEKIRNEEVAVKVIHSGVGAISESDVVLASASNAIVIGFDVKPDATAKEIAEREHVDVRLYNIIYKAIEDIEDAMKGMLAPVYEEKVIGHAEIRQIFKASGVGNIAGCMVKDGLVQRGAKARIMRGPKQDQVFEGEIASVKRFKDDVKEVKAGYECGLVFDGFNEIEVDDYVEVYVMEEVKR